MDDEFDDLGPHPDDDGFDTEQIINADDLVNFASNDDFDEGLRELFRIAPPEVTNQPLDPVLGKLALNGLSDKELRNRKIAMRQMADLKLQSGVNVIQAQGENPPYVVRVRQLEDGTVVKTQSLGALSRTIIDTPTPDNPQLPDIPEQDLTEPERGFMPFLWVGIHHRSGGDMRYPDFAGWGSERGNRFVYPHLVVYEPINPDSNDNATHNVISNRAMFTDQAVLPHLFGSHTEAVENREDLAQEGPTELYPDGRCVAESADTEVSDASKLEVWVNPAITGDDGDEFNYIATDYGENAQDHEEEYWDVIIRSRRTNDDTPVTDRSGAGCVTPRSGRYAIKVMMGGEWFIDQYNIHNTEFDLHVQIGMGPYKLIDKYEVTIEAYTGYLSSILPGGWFPRLRSSAAWYQEWADEDWNTPGVLQSFLTGSQKDETASKVPDRGTNGHGPWWWSGGVFAYMPPPQPPHTPERLFVAPILEEEIAEQDEPWRPDVEPNAVQFPADSIYHPRIDLSPAAALISDGFARNVINTTLAQMAFGGDQVKAKLLENAPEGCASASLPSTLSMIGVFNGDPDFNQVFGRLTSPPGVYTPMRGGTSRITIAQGESPGNGIDFWQENSCFGAVKDVRITVDIDDISPGIQELIDAELHPLSNPFVLYTSSTFQATARNGDDYGDGQISTIWSNTSTSQGSTESAWSAAGGFGGYFSADFSLNTYTRVMEVY
jgi:hypothetical protein